MARTVTLKIRSADFTTITRSTTLATATDQTELVWEAAAGLFAAWSRRQQPAVRLIGMSVSQLSAGEGQQQSLFGQEDDSRRRRLDQTIDEIRQRFGDDAVSRGGPRPDEP